MERGNKMIRFFIRFFKQPIVPHEEKLNEIRKANGTNGKKIDNMIEKINGSKLKLIIKEG